MVPSATTDEVRRVAVAKGRARIGRFVDAAALPEAIAPVDVLPPTEAIPIEAIPIEAIPIEATTVQALLRPARALQGSTSPGLEPTVGRNARGAGCFTVLWISRRLLARRSGGQALFDFGAVVVELAFQLVTVPRDVLAA